MWSKLPHEKIVSKDIIDLKTKEIDKTNLLNDLDNNMFLESSDDESDNEKTKKINIVESDDESENEFDYIKTNMLKVK